MECVCPLKKYIVPSIWPISFLSSPQCRPISSHSYVCCPNEYLDKPWAYYPLRNQDFCKPLNVGHFLDRNKLLFPRLTFNPAAASENNKNIMNLICSSRGSQKMTVSSANNKWHISTSPLFPFIWKPLIHLFWIAILMDYQTHPLPRPIRRVIKDHPL